MRIDILTLFPEMFAPLNDSIIKRACDKGVLEINIVNIRDFSRDKHLKCDDAPFGGGAGMIMTPQPVCDCIRSVDPAHEAKRIYLSPRGKLLTAAAASEYALQSRLLLLCGHYEGIDQRIIDLYIDEEVSIGDFVLTGGELPAMILTDVVARFVPGVLGSPESARDESFSEHKRCAAAKTAFALPLRVLSIRTARLFSPPSLADHFAVCSSSARSLLLSTYTTGSF